MYFLLTTSCFICNSKHGKIVSFPSIPARYISAVSEHFDPSSIILLNEKTLLFNCSVHNLHTSFKIIDLIKRLLNFKSFNKALNDDRVLINISKNNFRTLGILLSFYSQNTYTLFYVYINVLSYLKM